MNNMKVECKHLLNKQAAQPSITASISLQMVSSPLKGPQASDGLISAMEYPTGMMVTMKDTSRMEMKRALEREVLYSWED